jgi:hypothetical protein
MLRSQKATSGRNEELVAMGQKQASVQFGGRYNALKADYRSGMTKVNSVSIGVEVTVSVPS